MKEKDIGMISDCPVGLLVDYTPEEGEGPWVDSNLVLPPLCLTNSYFKEDLETFKKVSTSEELDAYYSIFDNELSKDESKLQEMDRRFETRQEISQDQYRHQIDEYRGMIIQEARKWFKTQGFYQNLIQLPISAIENYNNKSLQSDGYFKFDHSLILAAIGIETGINVFNYATSLTLAFNGYLWILPFTIFRLILFLPLAALEIFLGQTTQQSLTLGYQKVSKRLLGVGIAAALISLVLLVNQTVAIFYSARMVLSFFRTNIPWTPSAADYTTCNKYSSKTACLSAREYPSEVLEEVHPLFKVDGLEYCFYSKQNECLPNELYASTLYATQNRLNRMMGTGNSNLDKLLYGSMLILLISLVCFSNLLGVIKFAPVVFLFGLAIILWTITLLFFQVANGDFSFLSITDNTTSPSDFLYKIVQNVELLLQASFSYTGVGLGLLYVIASRCRPYRNSYSAALQITVSGTICIIYSCFLSVAFIHFFTSRYSIDPVEFLKVPSNAQIFAPMFFSYIPFTLAPNAIGVLFLTANILLFWMTHSIQTYVAFSFLKNTHLFKDRHPALITSLIVTIASIGVVFGVITGVFEENPAEEGRTLAIPLFQLVLITTIAWFRDYHTLKNRIGSSSIYIYGTAFLCLSISLITCTFYIQERKFSISYLCVVLGTVVFLVGTWISVGLCKSQETIPATRNILRKSLKFYDTLARLPTSDDSTNSSHKLRASIYKELSQIELKGKKRSVIGYAIMILLGIWNPRFYDSYSLKSIIRLELCNRLRNITLGTLPELRGAFNLSITSHSEIYLKENLRNVNHFKRSDWPFPLWVFVSYRYISPILLLLTFSKSMMTFHTLFYSWSHGLMSALVACVTPFCLVFVGIIFPKVFACCAERPRESRDNKKDPGTANNSIELPSSTKVRKCLGQQKRWKRFFGLHELLPLSYIGLDRW